LVDVESVAAVGPGVVVHAGFLASAFGEEVVVGVRMGVLVGVVVGVVVEVVMMRADDLVAKVVDVHVADVLEGLFRGRQVDDAVFDDVALDAGDVGLHSPRACFAFFLICKFPPRNPK
jgi:hypothetical protein